MLGKSSSKPTACALMSIRHRGWRAGGKDASPDKAEASQAVIAKPMVGTKRRVPSVLELLTAQGADASVAEGDKKCADIEARDDGSEKSTTQPVTVPSSAQAPAGSGALAQDGEGATEAAKVAGEAAKAEDGVPKPGMIAGSKAPAKPPHLISGKPSRRKTSGSRATEAFEARAGELPQSTA